MKRLLLVSHRPIDQAGGPSARWRSFVRHLPEHGWDVDVVSGRGGDEFGSPDTARARARVMEGVGRVASPVFRLAGLRPEAMPLSTNGKVDRHALRSILDREGVRESVREGQT